MNFVVYPVYKKKTNSENKIFVQPLGNDNGQNQTSYNKKKTPIILDHSKSNQVPKQKRG